MNNELYNVKYTIEPLEDGYKIKSFDDNMIIVQREPNIPYRVYNSDNITTDYSNSAKTHIENELNFSENIEILSLEEITKLITTLNGFTSTGELIRMSNSVAELEAQMAMTLLDSAGNEISHDNIVNKIEDLRIDFEVEHIK